MAEKFDIKSELLEECRFCEATLEGEVFDIFSIILDTVGSSSKSMHEAFEIATGIAISPEDSLTRSACGICYTRLKIIIDVRQKAKESYEVIISQQKKLILLEKRIKTIKGQTGQVSLSLRLCLICLSKESLTKIQRETYSYSDGNSETTLCQIYESVTGISVPDKSTFLCEKCIESLREFLRLCPPAKNVPRVSKTIKSLFICKYCDATFSSFKTCRLHLKTHQAERQNVCMICSKAFITQGYLITHLEKHYTTDESKCAICLVKYEDFFRYQEHFPCEIIDSHNQTNISGKETNESELNSFISPDVEPQNKVTPNMEFLDGYLCNYCSVKLTNPSLLTQHIKKQHSKNYCHLCKRFLSRKREFFLHMDTHITDNYYFCKVCWNEFDNISDYEHHGLIFHLMNVCRKCTYMGKIKTPLNSIKICDQTCRICSETFETFANYELHMRKKHKSHPTYRCNNCELKFGKLIFYIRHMNVSHNVMLSELKSLFQTCKKHMPCRIDKQMVCKICSKYFQHNSAFWDHTESEHPENICKICSKVFTTVGIMRKHLERHSKELPNLCNICAKIFPNPKSYRRHRRTKHKDYLCHICSETFTFRYKKMFMEHMDIHINEKYYICKVCFKEFEEVESYRTHVKIHEKKFICTLCTYTTKFPGKMKIHSSSHDRSRHYSCKQCSKKFYTVRDFNVHTAKHKIDRPCQCDICGLQFTHISNVYRHKYYVHKDRQCKICLKSFRGRFKFMKHFLKKRNFDYICKADTKRCLCKVCLEDFETTELCEAHFKSKHDKCICKICSSVVLLPVGMRTHMRAKHSK